VVFTFTFSGHFHSLNSSEVERAAGLYREDITYEGSTRRCTTNDQSFSATRDSQPTQTTAPPPPGSYTGAIPGNGTGMSFEVASSSLFVLAVRIPQTGLECSGGGSNTSTDKLEIAQAEIKGKTTFKATVTRKGEIAGAPVVFTYALYGHFHSINSSGVERAAGMYREEIAYEGSTRRCATNNQSFLATHN
jgi:hypothetical protein